MAWPEPDERVVAGARARRIDRGTAGLGLAGFGIAALLVVAFVGFTLRSCDLTVEEPTSRTGSRTERLPVGVAPTTGLDPDRAVLVTSRAFEADTVVGVVQCLREADSQRRGIDGCDETTLVRFAVDPGGVLAQPFTVRRLVRVGGRTHDCAARPGRCLVVAAASADYDRSGGQPITFRAGLGPATGARVAVPDPGADLPITATTSGPYRPGERVAVTASGFRPGEPLLLARCRTEFRARRDDLDVAARACAPLDEEAAMLAIGFGTLDGEGPRADARGRFTGAIGVARVVSPYAGDPVRCTSAGRCSIVVAAAADTRRSAVLPYEVAAT